MNNEQQTTPPEQTVNHEQASLDTDAERRAAMRGVFLSAQRTQRSSPRRIRATASCNRGTSCVYATRTCWFAR